MTYMRIQMFRGIKPSTLAWSAGTRTLRARSCLVGRYQPFFTKIVYGVHVVVAFSSRKMRTT